MKLDRLARFAWSVLAYNLVVILWGAYVRATGSGAGCGSHWPLCNGTVIPLTEQAATIIEFTHRASSGLALVAVVILVFWTRRVHPAGSVVRTGAHLSLFFIVLEALLGAGLVLFELVADDDSTFRAFSMVAHLVNTFILVGVLSLTAWWASGGAPIRVRRSGAPAGLIAGALLGLLVVGGTGAIAALGDTLFPSTSLESGLRESFSSESHPLIQLRKYHPLLAILVGLYAVALARHLARKIGTLPVRRLADLTTGVYVAQLIVGITNVALLAPVSVQMLHLLLADLVWIALVLLGASALADESYVAPRGPSRTTVAAR